jgi:radical SAM protein with 4Fe4S-binding SPASM domain
MCPRKYMTGPKGYLSFSLFTEIIDEIAERENIALVPFFRGESLLHPRCIEMLAYAKRKGVGPIQFATNGTLMTENVAHGLIDLEMDFVSFSLDSIDPKDYSQIRKGADLGTVLRNIEFFCSLKEKRERSKPEIQVSVVKTSNTSDGIEDFVNFWQQRVDRVRVYEEHSQDGNFGSLSKEEGDAVYEERKPCLKVFTDMVIYWNGSVALCNHDWDRTESLGNVQENSIYEIWHSNTYKRVREAHLGQSELEELCKGCDHWKAYYRKESLIGELYAIESEMISNA